MNQKTLTHLHFLEETRELCAMYSWRLVVYGGYGLDMYVGHLTREHGDVDIVIYGQSPRVEATKVLMDYFHTLRSGEQIEMSENAFQVVIDYHCDDLVINAYYVQTKNDPFVSLREVITQDGKVVTNDPTIFPDPEKGKIGEHEFDVQNQRAHLRDILQKGGAQNPKYDNDRRFLSDLV